MQDEHKIVYLLGNLHSKQLMSWERNEEVIYACNI